MNLSLRTCACAAVGAVILNPGLRAATFTVNTTLDEGPGSLRQAILDANATPGPDVIQFDFSSEGVVTLSLLTDLPKLIDPVTVDGTSKWDYAGLPLIELDGSLLTSALSQPALLRVSAGGSRIQALLLNRSPGAGIILAGAPGAVIEGCYIGADATGSGGAGNAGPGIWVAEGSEGCRIGGTSAGAGNVISANDPGVWLFGEGCQMNVVEGNRIGTDASGVFPLGNTNAGVLVEYPAVSNRIGGTIAAARNVICDNDNGIQILQSAANVIQGNWIGVDATGLAPLGNRYDGLHLIHAAGTLVGGTNDGAGNVISGNSRDGVVIGNAGSSNNVVQGNYIGVDPTGTATLPNGRIGVLISLWPQYGITSASANLIGGSTPGAGNVISGNLSGGVRLVEYKATGNLVLGNIIGADATGTQTLGNGDASGIYLRNAPGNTIGGPDPGARNLISGNIEGITLTEAAASNNVVQGNWIGLQSDGISPLGNLSHGIRIATNAGANWVGGFDPGMANRIAFNGGDGIRIESGVDNRLAQNAIHQNSGLGIDLLPAGVTANDDVDSDSGPNQLQNFPRIASATAEADSTTIEGTLASQPDSPYRIEFFANPSCDPSGHGQGETFVGSVSVDTDGGGKAGFSVVLPTILSEGQFVCATATDETGNTSEFSPCAPVAGSPVAFSLTVQRAGDGSGRVLSQPPGIDCGEACAWEFPVGTTVTLTAEAAPGSRFVGWNGDGSGTPDRIITLDADQTVTAEFELEAVETADLAIALEASPDPVLMGDTLTCTLTVTNRGPADALEVTATSTWPAAVDFSFVGATQGSHATNGTDLSFALGTLTAGSDATITIALRPPVPPVIETTASVRFEGTELDPVDNERSLSISVIPAPALRIQPAGPGPSVTELTLTFPVVPGYDAVVQSRDPLGAGTGWQALPEPPHNSGSLTITNAAPLELFRAYWTAR